MAELDHTQHEMFCHFVARGNVPLTAYIGAGYTRDNTAANALMKLPRIKARIAELSKTTYAENASDRTRAKRAGNRNG